MNICKIIVDILTKHLNILNRLLCKKQKSILSKSISGKTKDAFSI